jgi:catechol 2,3-dioxygenase-like lactoylglutathione lyase family enzyme
VAALALNHTSFTVSDLDRSIAFYRDALGLELQRTIRRRGPWIGRMTGLPGADLRIAALAVPGASHVLELIEYVVPPGTRRPRLPTNDVGSAHLGFAVDDIEREYVRLRALGVEFVSPPVRVDEPPGEGSWGAYFRDPDGIPLELQQRAEGF